jgi:hypothetical protein
MGLVFWLFGWLQMGRPALLAADAELPALVLVGLLAGLAWSTIDRCWYTEPFTSVIPSQPCTNCRTMDSALGEHCQASWLNLAVRRPARGG